MSASDLVYCGEFVFNTTLRELHIDSVRYPAPGQGGDQTSAETNKISNQGEECMI